MLTKIFQPSKTETKFSIHKPNIIYEFAKKIQPFFREASAANRDLIFICIGTDRSTGDALGPLTGSKLKNLRLPYQIYGTLDAPVHATNLQEHLSLVQKSYGKPFIIAIDACLGQMDNVGYLSYGRGSVKPGTAVKKDLPAVGDAYITGIVNVSGFMEHMVLQSTRLNLVMKMADTIAGAISFATYDFHSLSNEEQKQAQLH